MGRGRRYDPRMSRGVAVFVGLGLSISVIACATTTDSGCMPGVWTSESTQLDISMQYFPKGFSSWTAKRSEMSPAMLSTLSGLCSLSPRVGTYSDPQALLFRITDANQQVRTYRAAVNEAHGNIFGNNLRILSYSSVQSIIPTGCLFSQDRDWTVDDAGSDPWSDAAIASDGPGCIPSLQVKTACVPRWFKLTASAVADYTLTMVDCPAKSRIHVRSPDGTKEIAVSPLAASPSCASLTYHVDAPATYIVEIEADDGQGCPIGLLARVRVRH